MKKKKFVPHGFFSAKQIEKMNGVYFPYWMVDWRGDTSMEAEATKVRTWRTGDTEYRETQFYRVYREGNVEFDDMPKIALQKANRKLVEGVQPYDQKAVKPFSMGYLSGFQAERRDLEKEAFGAEIARDTEQYAKRVLENDMRGYTTVRPVHQQVGNRQGAVALCAGSCVDGDLLKEETERFIIIPSTDKTARCAENFRLIIRN